jgi:DNA-binding LacI/PurR family transcriptional regulator
VKQSDARRPTIRDVAAVAGVSRGTVSRVLNGGKWVSPDAAAAVNDAIKKTRYRVNPHARNLATSKSNSVAFLLTEPQHVLFDDPNFSQLVRGTAQALAAKDMSLVLIIAGTPAEQARATEYITGGHVDGVLLAFSSHGGNPLVASLIESGIPVVACGQPLGFESKLGCVSADDFNGGRQMVDYLRSTGRKRIAIISGPEDTPGGVGRLAGYRASVGADYRENLVAHGDYSRASGAAAMERLLRDAPDLDAVFVASDVMAAGAIAVLQAAGRRIPEDVAVGGFDDSAIAMTTTPTLTTMHQPFDRISSEMVRMLIESIAGESPATITLPTTLIKRESA